NMEAALRRVYAGGVRFFPVDLAAEGAWPDPHAAKYSAEIAAAGGQHYLDVSHDPAPTGRSYLRLFVLPEDHRSGRSPLLYGTAAAAAAVARGPAAAAGARPRGAPPPAGAPRVLLLVRRGAAGLPPGPPRVPRRGLRPAAGRRGRGRGLSNQGGKETSVAGGS